MTSRFDMDKARHHTPTTPKQEREMDAAEDERNRLNDAVAHEVTLCRSLGQGSHLKAYEAFQERGHGVPRDVFDQVEDTLWQALSLDERAQFADDVCDSLWPHLAPPAPIIQHKEAA